MNYFTSGICLKYKLFLMSHFNIFCSYVEKNCRVFHNWNILTNEIFHYWSIINTEHSYIGKFMKYSTDGICFKIFQNWSLFSSPEP